MTTVMEKETSRKRKVDLEEESELSTSSVQLKTRRLDVLTPENLRNSVDDSDRVLVSCCSSEGSKRNLKSVDLEEDENEAIIEFVAKTIGDSDSDFRDRREATPLSELDSSLMLKIPSEHELEEFFAAAERDMQKKFIEKYNFDIVKDEPLEGRYEWVPIHRDLK